jgi:hypothetical protein
MIKQILRVQGLIERPTVLSVLTLTKKVTIANHFGGAKGKIGVFRQRNSERKRNLQKIECELFLGLQYAKHMFLQFHILQK